MLKEHGDNGYIENVILELNRSGIYYFSHAHHIVEYYVHRVYIAKVPAYFIGLQQG